jgi:hypothetical protein
MIIHFEFKQCIIAISFHSANCSIFILSNFHQCIKTWQLDKNGIHLSTGADVKCGETHLLLTLGIGALDRWVCRNFMRCVRCGFMGLLEPLVALT